MGTNSVDVVSASSQKIRRNLLIVGVVVLVIALASALVLFWFGGTDTDNSKSPEKLEDVDVHVVDAGFSVYQNDGTYWEQSFGYLVENRSNQTAIAEVEYWYVDRAGDKVGAVERSRPFYVLPKEEVGGGATGWWGKIDNEKSIIDDVKYKVYAVGIGEAKGFDKSTIESKFISRDRDASVHEYESMDLLHIGMNSDFESAVKAESMGILYRDSSGEIIGGWGPFQHLPYRDSDEVPEQSREVPGFDVPTGEDSVEVSALTPPTLDDDQTSVYITPFVARDADDPRWTCVKCTLKG